MLKRVMVGLALCLGLFVRSPEPASAANFGTAVGLTGQPAAGIVEVRYHRWRHRHHRRWHHRIIAIATGTIVIGTITGTGIITTGTTGVTTGTGDTFINTGAFASRPRPIARGRSVRFTSGGSQRGVEQLALPRSRSFTEARRGSS